MGPSICVIGAGVVGMTAAVNIADSLPAASVTVLGDKFTPDTTSDVAAGFCLPHMLADTPEHLVRRWFVGTFDYLLSVSNSPVASEAGVSLLTGYILSSTTNAVDVVGLDKTFGLRKLSMEEFPLCGTPNTSGMMFTTLLAEGGKFLPWLMETFEAKGGQVVRRKIGALSEVQYTLCSRFESC
ncbi:D-aspartate oxidase [Lamellibrachia satsuma]|nr:D-aspartate oxidase [Lamellibrachia satsuma]